MGLPDRPAVVERIRTQWHEAPIEADWAPELAARLQAFMQGQVDDFRDVELEPSVTTDFQRAVIQAVRQIPYGETASYAEVARRAGSPKAARGVGGVMAANRLPILIPCHRVVASGGGIGGFSAPTGVDLKRWLLERESGADR